jgi:hypothetical protein
MTIAEIGATFPTDGVVGAKGRRGEFALAWRAGRAEILSALAVEEIAVGSVDPTGAMLGLWQPKRN